MTDPNGLPPYPDSTKPTIGGTGSGTQQVQYMQQPYIQPGGQVQYIQQPYMQPGGPVYVIHPGYINPMIAQIHDWLPWSIVNIFIGWIFAGILPLIFSLVCRNYKRSNNASGARTMSTLALVFNILITLGGIAGWILLIVLVAVVDKTVCAGYYISC